MSCFFAPYVGKAYEKTKMLILGESHYCDQFCNECGDCKKHPECSNFTNFVIKDYYLDSKNEREGWMNTYLKFERSLVGHITSPVESAQIWDNIAFYNYLQVAMGGPRQAGTIEQYKQSESALFDILNQLQPKLMIVWGKQLWHHLPNTYWSDDEPLIVQIKEECYEHNEIGHYTLPNGHIVHTLCVYHPSAGYDWSFWYNVIETMKNRISL